MEDEEFPVAPSLEAVKVLKKAGIGEERPFDSLCLVVRTQIPVSHLGSCGREETAVPGSCWVSWVLHRPVFVS